MKEESVSFIRTVVINILQRTGTWISVWLIVKPGQSLCWIKQGGLDSGIAPKNRLFCPLGLATDSQCQILISDISNNCIDVIDQDGQFLRYIDCGLKCPWGICTDKNDHLLVAEKGGTLRKIKYLSN